MKKYFVFTLIALFLVSCSPTENQIQAAIEQTEQAKPTSTSTPEPTATITPTLEPSPTSTPIFKYIDGVTNEDIVALYMNAGIMCGDQEVLDDGTYKQTCGWPIDDGLLEGEITGNSEDTVDSYRAILLPFKGEDISDQAINIFYELTKIGTDSDIEEIHKWINENVDALIHSEEESVKTLEISGYYLMLIGQNGVIGLMIMGTN